MKNKSEEIRAKIYEIMEEKQITYKMLGERLGMRTWEIRKKIQDAGNFTIKTITRIEEGLGEKIIEVTYEP